MSPEPPLTRSSGSLSRSQASALSLCVRLGLAPGRQQRGQPGLAPGLQVGWPDGGPRGTKMSSHLPAPHAGGQCPHDLRAPNPHGQSGAGTGGRRRGLGVVWLWSSSRQVQLLRSGRGSIPPLCSTGEAQLLCGQHGPQDAPRPRGPAHTPQPAAGRGPSARRPDPAPGPNLLPRTQSPEGGELARGPRH